MVTSASPRLLRAVEPLKMTSVISPPRRLLADCSPSTQRTASTTLDLPDPFGPTTAVTPGGNSNTVLSAKLLNPTNSRRFSMVCLPGLAAGGARARPRETRGRPRRPPAAQRSALLRPAGVAGLLVQGRRRADFHLHGRQPVALAR